MSDYDSCLIADTQVSRGWKPRFAMRILIVPWSNLRLHNFVYLAYVPCICFVCACFVRDPRPRPNGLFPKMVVFHVCGAAILEMKGRFVESATAQSFVFAVVPQ